jgi:hypothetical protein
MSDMTLDQTKAQCTANVALTKAQAIRQLADGGYTPESVRDAVVADDFALLVTKETT